MAAAKKLSITLKTIQEASNAKSFSRGKSYSSDGSIYNAMRQADRLWANCSGSDEYETSVTLNKSKIQSSSCSCPYDWGGLCKHQVALLLTYLDSPDQFKVIPPLAEFLKPKSRAELETLIEKMLEQSPSLLSLLETQSATSNPSKAKSINLSAYQQQITRAFRSREMHSMASALNKIVKVAEGFFSSGNWQDSGRLYQLLLQESIDSYDENVMEVDHDGEVGCVIQDMAAGLTNCFVNPMDEPLRESWLKTLLDATFQDIDLGGMDFAAGAWEGLLDCAQDHDWGWIEATIRQKIKQHHGSQWAQDTLVELLSEQLMHIGDEDGADDIIEELGSSSQKVFLWARQGQWDAAIALAKASFKTKPGLVYQLADMLLEADQSKLALKYVLSEDPNTNWKRDEWLENYYGRFGTRKEAIEASMKGFQKSPSLARYLKLKELHPKKQDWKPLQGKIFDQLEATKNFELWIDIMLSDGDLDRAIELLGELRPSHRFSKLVAVAQVAATEKPKAAIEIYQMLVADFIASKTRSAYQSAVVYLKKIRSLYESTKQKPQWDSYIASLRASYPTLRALQEELTIAKL
jgi:uncharacterized Zn finger protein